MATLQICSDSRRSLFVSLQVTIIIFSAIMVFNAGWQFRVTNHLGHVPTHQRYLVTGHLMRPENTRLRYLSAELLKNCTACLAMLHNPRLAIADSLGVGGDPQILFRRVALKVDPVSRALDG